MSREERLELELEREVRGDIVAMIYTKKSVYIPIYCVSFSVSRSGAEIWRTYMVRV